MIHPVKKALNTWKKSNPEGTMQQFAEALGYKQADTVYRLLRNEIEPPITRIKKISELGGGSVGSVSNYFAENVTKTAEAL